MRTREMFVILSLGLSASQWVFAETPTEAVPEASTPPPQVQMSASGSEGISAGITLDELLKIRDPFRRLIAVQEKGELRALTELEQYPVEEFKMVGVITGPKRTRAMVRTPSGSTHFVAVNQKLGTRSGHVTRITADYLEVTEKVTNILGRDEVIRQKLEIAPEYQSDSAGGSP